MPGLICIIPEKLGLEVVKVIVAVVAVDKINLLLEILSKFPVTLRLFSALKIKPLVPTPSIVSFLPNVLGP